MGSRVSAHRLYHQLLRLKYATPRNVSFIYRGAFIEANRIEEEVLHRQLQSLLLSFELDVRENEKNEGSPQYETTPIALSDETIALQEICVRQVKEHYQIRY